MARISVGMAALPNAPHALYRFYDASDVLLYVGITMDFPTRMANHKTTKPWWTHVAHVRVEHFDTRTEALTAERKAIKEEHPLYNDQHNSYVEAQETVDEFAGRVLEQLVDNWNEYAEVVAEAKANIVEEGKSGSPHRRAALDLASVRMSDVYGLERAVRHLLDQMSPGQVRRVREAEELETAELYESLGLSIDDQRAVLCGTADRIAFELASAYLAGLPDQEREDWILIGEHVGGYRPGAPIASLTAARCAREYAESGRKPEGICRGPGCAPVGCPNAITTTVWFADCTVATCGDGCCGHWLFCENHLGELLVGILARTDGPELTPSAYETGTGVPF